MGDVANQDEAKKCLDIANAALQAGNLDKATRFAEKAMKLYPHDEVPFSLPYASLAAVLETIANS